MPWKDAVVARVKASPAWLAASALKKAVKAMAAPVVQRLKLEARALIARVLRRP
jgi:hypothetical protein